MGEEDEILKKTLFSVSDLSPRTQLVDISTESGQALSQVCSDIKKILPTDHVRCWDAKLMGLQDELRNSASPIRMALADGFHNLVIVEVSRGLSPDGAFQYDELFLPYLRDVLFEAFGVEPTYNFHPEQISQVLKDEPRSLFCFFDAEYLSEADALRLRGFTQEFHRVLMCARRTRSETFENTASLVLIKVQLIVVQGNLEGKVIPLVGPIFRIGRGERCHLRPSSVQVSREHAEFSLTADTVSIRDLGSVNGTKVNGKALTQSIQLKDRDLVEIGPLRLAVAITKFSVSARTSERSSTANAPADVVYDELDAWLVADRNNVVVHDEPSGKYVEASIAAFKDSATPNHEADASDEEFERLLEQEDDVEEIIKEATTDSESEGDTPRDLID